MPYLLAGQNKWLVTDRRLLTSQKLEGGGFRCARLDEIHTLRISMGSVSISHAGGRPIRLPYPGDPQTVATAIHRSMERRAEARNKP